jgi:hypothetical protein
MAEKTKDKDDKDQAVAGNPPGGQSLAADGAPKAPRRRMAERDDGPPGGLFIKGGFDAEDDLHYGGELYDAEGHLMARFGEEEHNPGKDWVPPADWEPPKGWQKPDGWDQYFRDKGRKKV